ncbi:hypothetical protein [Thiomicrorhabdus lithotrophica]|uniref:Uncharacterized protein n=1 Tax=Thiomicrorhabdus lithotrophica TaxID=2949997 RepID=A0ABY8CAB9_9GAMM|nr:hypothetical protein [Thiomicrorhabdus lithotrophica]WEJ62177.1 hypothetical protein NR989_09165 [Thiomicrorhabdus lithotrophica]
MNDTLTIEQSASQNGKTFFDIALSLYDKNPALTGTILVLIFISPIVIAWFSFLKKKEETKMAKYQHLANKRKSRKNRKGKKHA